jgi:hypothetical protein
MPGRNDLSELKDLENNASNYDIGESVETMLDSQRPTDGCMDTMIHAIIEIQTTMVESNGISSS